MSGSEALVRALAVGVCGNAMAQGKDNLCLQPIGKQRSAPSALSAAILASSFLKSKVSSSPPPQDGPSLRKEILSFNKSNDISGHPSWSLNDD